MPASLTAQVQQTAKAPKVLALVQARMGSTRLPCKSLLALHGKPLIDWVVERVSRSALIDRLVVASPDTPDNDPLALYLANQGVSVFRGSENDVLGRFYQAAKSVGATAGSPEDKEGTLIVRICADNPLIWGPELDTLVRFYRENSYDYAYNHIPRGNLYPDGLGGEIVSFALLETLAQKAVLATHREHCLSYIWDNSGAYSIGTFDPKEACLQRPDIKLDIDTVDDYRTLALLPLRPDMRPESIVSLFPLPGSG